MADDKKDNKKAGGGGSAFSEKHYQEVLYFVLPGLIILSVLLNRLLAYINRFDESSILGETQSWLLRFWLGWKPFAAVLTIAGIVWAGYSLFKLKKVEEEEKKIFGVPPDDAAAFEMTEKEMKKRDDWEKVLTHAHSNNPAEWRVAIIEADTMLEEVLRASGYHGEGVGELLKSVDPTDLLTLDAAWEAHKVRNRIAHAGQDFDLTERETRRIISLFESVFKELRMI